MNIVFAGWITFTKRFKSTRKTISLNMVLATLLKHLPILTVNVFKTSLHCKNCGVKLTPAGVNIIQVQSLMVLI